MKDIRKKLKQLFNAGENESKSDEKNDKDLKKNLDRLLSQVEEVQPDNVNLSDEHLEIRQLENELQILLEQLELKDFNNLSESDYSKINQWQLLLTELPELKNILLKLANNKPNFNNLIEIIINPPSEIDMEYDKFLELSSSDPGLEYDKGFESPTEHLSDKGYNEELGSLLENPPHLENDRESAPVPVTPPKSVKSNRYVNYDFYVLKNNTRSQLGKYDALVEDNLYYLEVWISPIIAGKLLYDEKNNERRSIRDPKVKEDVTIYVLFKPDFDDFEVYDLDKQLQTITLSSGGKNDSTRANIRLRPRHRDKIVEIDVEFFYNFNAIDSIHIEAEVVRNNFSRPKSSVAITATQIQLGDWIYVDDLERREMNITVESLEGSFRLYFIYEGIEFPGILQITREEIEDLIVRLRKKIEYLAVDKNSPIKRRSTIDFKKEVVELAREGKSLWAKLFFAKKESALGKISKLLKKHPLKEGGIIQVRIKKKVKGFIFPWNLLYDGEYPIGEDTQPNEILKGFWGMRYSIEQVYEDWSGYEWCTKSTEIHDQLKLNIMLHDGLPNSDKQKQLFNGFVRDSSNKIIFERPISSAETFSELLDNCDSHILYFYSRGFTRKREADIGYKSDSKKGEKGEPIPQRSYIELSKGYIYLDELEIKRDSVNLIRNPLVILNLCESAQIVPSLTEGFIPFFLDLKAKAVLGTECPMTTDFAHPFAEILLNAILSGDMLGKALLKTRREFLRTNEFLAPLGLAYSLFGTASVSYKPPLLPKSFPKPLPLSEH